MGRRLAHEGLARETSRRALSWPWTHPRPPRGASHAQSTGEVRRDRVKAGLELELSTTEGGCGLALLLIIYGRQPAKTANLTGDTDFLDFYLSQVSFG